MRVLRAEWLKWRTVRSHWVLVILGMGIPLVVTLLTAMVRSGDRVERSSVYSLVFGASYVTAMVAGVLGAVVSAGEFGHLTIRPTFAAVPRRGAVLLAKAVLALLVGATMQVTVAVVAAHGSFLILGWRGIQVDSSVRPPTTVLVSSVVFVALMTMLGHALGCLMRSAPLSITTIILWPLLVESIVGALIALSTDSMTVGAWMPFQAGFRMLEYGQLDLGGGPGRLSAGLYFGGVALGVTLLSSAVTARRDA